MAQKEQSFQNHARRDPAFLVLTFGALAMLIAAVVRLVQTPDWWGVARLVGILWLIVLMFKVRLYALKVQDRVIRLEERLRLAQLLNDSLRLRIGELSEVQLIGLRFASDAELPGLVEKTLAGNLGQKEIKQAIQNWRPDHWRV